MPACRRSTPLCTSVCAARRITTTLSSWPGRDERLLEPGRQHQHRREHVHDERHAAGGQRGRQLARAPDCARCRRRESPSPVAAHADARAGRRRCRRAPRATPACTAATTPTSSAAPSCMHDRLVAHEEDREQRSRRVARTPSRERERQRDAEERRRRSAMASDSPKISAATNARAEAQRLQRRVLGAALARGHRHRVRHHRHDDHDDDEATPPEIASRIVSVIATNDSWNAFSVSVSVSASEFLNVASIAARHLGRLLRVAQLRDEHAGLVGAARVERLDRLVQETPSGRTSSTCRSSRSAPS